MMIFTCCAPRHAAPPPITLLIFTPAIRFETLLSAPTLRYFTPAPLYGAFDILLCRCCLRLCFTSCRSAALLRWRAEERWRSGDAVVYDKRRCDTLFSPLIRFDDYFLCFTLIRYDFHIRPWRYTLAYEFSRRRYHYYYYIRLRFSLA